MHKRPSAGAIFSGLSSIAWLAMGGAMLRGVTTLPSLPPWRGEARRGWPSLSVVIAACDEEAALSTTIQTLLDQSYPALEIFLINDRSSDQTGPRIDALASADARVHALHIETLPAGWLGKVHALHTAASSLNSDWLLFSDADVDFQHPDVLKAAIAAAEKSNIDHLALLPKVLSWHFLQAATLAAFSAAYVALTRPAKLADPSSPAIAGVGAFNLVRGDVFRRSAGFESLRMEIADDVGLGRVMKDAGGRLALMTAIDQLQIDWYPSVGAMVRGLEKNLFGVIGGYRRSRAWAAAAAATAITLGPWWGGLRDDTARWRRPPLLAAASLIATAFALHRRVDIHPLAALSMPLGSGVLIAALLRSAERCTRDQGVTWRGTFYPLDALRAGQKFDLIGDQLRGLKRGD